MRFEIPECKRCCCCVPMRHGILVFGYLKLVFTIFFLCLEMWLGFGVSLTSSTMALYRGVSFHTQMWLMLLLYIMELIFIIVLVIGAHAKIRSLLQAYYYFGITTTVAALVIFVVVRFTERHHFALDFVIDASFAFFCFVLQIYLLLLIRTELKKQRYKGQITFVNHMSEVVVNSPSRQDGTNPL